MGAAYPVAPGFRDIGNSSMKFIPVLYSGKLLKKYYDTTLLAVVTNTDYEGEIRKFGDTVYVRTVPNMVIRDYKKGQTLVNDQPESVAVEMKIDQGKYWSFVSEDLDKVQTDLKGYIGQWTTDGAEQMRIAIDSDVLSYMPGKVHAKNTGATAGVRSGKLNLGASGSPLTLAKNDVLDYIVDCGTALDEQNVPESGRFLIIPPLVAGLIKKSDLKDASLTGDGRSVIRTGLLGSVDRFNIYVSNLLATATDGGNLCWKMLFGHRDGTSFATQLVESKVQDNPNGFGMLHRGLNVYGREVLKPEAVGMLYGHV